MGVNNHLLSLIWTKGTILDTHLPGFLKNIFPLTCSHRETSNAPPNLEVFYSPSTNSHWERPNAHPFERKILISSLVSTERAQIIGCFKKYFFPTSVPTRNLTVALPSSCRKRQLSQGRIRSALFSCQGALRRTLSLIRTGKDGSFTLF